MTTQQTAIDARFEEKLETLMPRIDRVANGDEDLEQVGAIGVWEAMSANLEATDAFYFTRAKWNIQTQLQGVGKSVDIPKTHPRRTPVSVVHFEAQPDNGNALLGQAVLADRKRVPLDEWVIQKMDFNRFLNTLSTQEYGYVHLKMVAGMPDAEASKRLNVSIERLRGLKQEIREKVEDYYGI